ncbi:MAG: hypothetical protein PHO07_09290 [Pirellulales bacterium]|nr:hypothetical protein [Thermoguttaceae bacterium]MDD4787355.1 hypothetical protein [Pirellulales bacterium]NLZ02558.1 LamG domain-containing protein [Pirellulaceae bacterium]
MKCRLAALCVLWIGSAAALPGEPAEWWNPEWRLRTTVERPAPYGSEVARPVEVAVDFARLLEKAGLPGKFAPGSLRVVERDSSGKPSERPSAWRTQFDPERGTWQGYVAWIAQPRAGSAGTADIYFDVEERGIKPPDYDPALLPAENLLANPGFERLAGRLPEAWEAAPAALVQSDRFRHTTGKRSLKVVVDESTRADIGREITLSQRVDVRRYAGQEIVFECDLMAERAAYGAPVAITIEQYRDDGSRIPEDAVEPRWLNIELAQGQLVQFRERGRFSELAATARVLVRMRCLVRDADTATVVTGPDACFTVWLDRFVLRPGERWPWPAATGAGFVPGALADAPLNRGFEFTGLRRVAFNGASEATLANGYDDPDPRSVHWGLAAGTLEFWCRPAWSADDGQERVFFDSVAYGHRLHSRLRKLGGGGNSDLEFSIADAGGTLRSVRAFAPFQRDAWHHLAATWDFSQARLALFFDGKRIGQSSPGESPWPSSLVSKGTTAGIGIAENDSRSLPMQAFLGGDADCRADRAAEAVLDEVRISDCARYDADFAPQRRQFTVDEQTRALWHFENQWHAVHAADDRFVRGHLACELPRQQETVPLDMYADGKIESRPVAVRPRAPESRLAENRAANRLTVTRPFQRLPDPRFVEYRSRQAEWLIASPDDTFTVTASGDWEPLMESLTFEPAGGTGAAETAIPHWRAGDRVVPLSVATLNETLAPGIDDEARRALEVFRYALATTNYFDAHYCETLPARHRPRVSYTLVKALNIYPFDQCGPLNHTLRKLFLTAGISSQDCSGTHHQFEQAFYLGSWRLFDLSPRVYWLNRDNATVASRRAFEDDLYLKLREGSGVQSALRGRRHRPSLGTAERPHSMEFPLRGGEQVRFGWWNEGRWFELTGNREPIHLAKIPPYFGNGSILYQPRREAGAGELENLALAPLGDGLVLRAIDPQRHARLLYRVACPYILSDALVRGAWRADRPDALRASVSFDQGKTWKKVWRNAEPRGELAIDLRAQAAARYIYWLKLDFEPDGGASLADLGVRTTFVVSPLSLPATLRRGENRITVAGGPAETPVKSVCRWVERHRSDLGIGIDAISYYLDGDRSHRRLLVAPGGASLPIEVTIEGRRCEGEVSVEGLPPGWTVAPERQAVALAGDGGHARARLLLKPASAPPGEIRRLELVFREAGQVRRTPFEVLAAPAGLACEAEACAAIEGGAEVQDSAENSQGRIVAFTGQGRLSCAANVLEEGPHALWLRARWEPGGSTQLDLAVDGAEPRRLTAAAMIGFTDWDDPRRAHTKCFAHFGEAHGHWAWYRIGDVPLEAGQHRLTLSAQRGACLDALVLLPQTPDCDRAAMNLFQNWNYACDGR